MGAEGRHHLAGLGVTTGLGLGEQAHVIDVDLEDPAARGHEDELGDVVLVLFEQLGRQTDGLLRVASDRAVLDADAH